jgi:hypothetical protein
VGDEREHPPDERVMNGDEHDDSSPKTVGMKPIRGYES